MPDDPRLKPYHDRIHRCGGLDDRTGARGRDLDLQSGGRGSAALTALSGGAPFGGDLGA